MILLLPNRRPLSGAPGTSDQPNAACCTPIRGLDERKLQVAGFCKRKDYRRDMLSTVAFAH